MDDLVSRDQARADIPDPAEQTNLQAFPDRLYVLTAEPRRYRLLEPAALPPWGIVANQMANSLISYAGRLSGPVST